MSGDNRNDMTLQEAGGKIIGNDGGLENNMSGVDGANKGSNTITTEGISIKAAVSQ
jgi:hypothetical protein